MSKISNFLFALLLCHAPNLRAQNSFPLLAETDLGLSRTMDAYHELAVEDSVEMVKDLLFEHNDNKGAWHSIERHVFRNFPVVEELAAVSLAPDEKKYFVVTVRCADQKGASITIDEHWLKVADGTWRLVPLELIVPECPGKKRYGIKQIDLTWHVTSQPCEPFRWSTIISSGLRLGGKWHHLNEKPSGPLPHIMTIQLDSLVRGGVNGPERIVASAWHSRINTVGDRRELVETHFLIVESLEP